MILLDDEAIEENTDVTEETETTTTSTSTRYQGSAFASLLVVILFVVWFLHRCGYIIRN